MASFTDDFNRANGAPGTDWDTLIGGMSIVSNALVATVAAAYSYAVCDPTTPGVATDNFRCATTVTDGVEVMDTYIRLGEPTANYDAVQCKWEAGVGVRFGYSKDAVDTDSLIVNPTVATWTAADVLEVQAFDGVYTALKNSVPLLSWQDPGNAIYANVNSTHRLSMLTFQNSVANKGANSYTTADITTSAWTAPTVVATASSTLTASRSPTVTFPASWIPAADDVVILAPSSTALTATITAPSGWSNVLGGTTDVRSDVHQLCAVAYTVTSADASAVTRAYTATNLYSVTQTGNTVGIVVRGADVANLIDSSAVSSNVNNTTAHVIPALTGTNLSTNSLAVGIVVKHGTGTYTLSNGWQTLASNNTNSAKVICSYGLPMTAGTNLAAGTATTATDEYCSITLALTAKPTTTGFTGAGTSTTTAAITGTGTTSSNGTVTAAATITGSGVVARTGAGTSITTATIAGVGAAVIAGAGTQTATATIAGAGTTTGTGAVTVTATRSGGGAVAVTGSGSLTVAAAVSGAAGAAGFTGAGSSTTTATIAGAGTTTGAGTRPVTATLTGSGLTAAVGAGTSTTAATITGSGVVGVSGAGPRTATATVTGAGTSAGAGTLTATGTATGTGVLATTGAGSLTVAATIAGSAGTLILGAGTRSTTATIAGAGTAAATGTGTSTTTATIAGAGTAAATGTGTSTTTATITGAGVVAVTGSGTRPVTATIAGSSGVGYVGTGTRTVTATITGAGALGSPAHGGTITAITVITGSGIVARKGNGTLLVVASITGSAGGPPLPQLGRIASVRAETRTAAAPLESRTTTAWLRNIEADADTNKRVVAVNCENREALIMSGET